ncbi:MAG: triose-phosphate isomerase [Patescibacteria group bacterium]|jgi:triosephosphate isomerase
MILVNYKVYEESFGEGAIRLAWVCKKVMEASGVMIFPVVTPFDAYRIKEEVGIEVMIQTVDGDMSGAQTGAISTKQAKRVGVFGSLINHSERRLPPGTIKSLLRNWPDNFVSVVCIQTLGQSERWAKNIKPDYIAYEPTELIGNKTKSVATEKPEVIEKIVKKYKNVPVLVGAGIHSKEDVEMSVKCGARGILVASDVVKAKDPEKELSELASGFGVIIENK